MSTVSDISHKSVSSRPWALLGAGAAIFVVFFFLSGGSTLITGDVESSLLAKLLWSSIYALTGVLVYRHSRSVWHVVEHHSGFMLLALLCCLSVIWSSDRPATVSASIGMMGSTLLGYLLAAKVEPLQFFRPVAFALFTLLAINVILMLPSLTANLSGNIRYSGIFTHPNMLGRNAGLSVLLMTALMSYRFIPLAMGAIGIGMGALLLISCGSMTSFLALVVAMVVLFMRKSVGGPVGGGYIAVAFWMVFCSMGLLTLFWEPVLDYLFGLMGRSTNLTGRVPLWVGVWEAVTSRPLFGYGYYAFWSGEPALAEQIYARAWEASGAHNGLLDIGLGLGGLGITFFVVSVGRSFVSGFKHAFMGNQPLSIVAFSLIIYVLMLGLTESTYLRHNSDKWVLLLVCCVYLRRIGDPEFATDEQAKRPASRDEHKV